MMKKAAVAIGLLVATAGFGVLGWSIIGSSINDTVRGLAQFAKSVVVAQSPPAGSVVVLHRDTVASITSKVSIQDAASPGLRGSIIAASPTAHWVFDSGDSALRATWHPTQDSQAPIVLYLLADTAADREGFRLRCGYVLVERAPRAIPLVVDAPACPSSKE